MALTKVLGWFSKPGKGFPQTNQVDFEGKPVFEKDGKTPVTGNEQYQAEQLTDESVSHESAEAFMNDVLESVNGDLELAAEMFRTGWNRVTRLRAGGLDEYQKAAKGIIKLGLPWAKGLSVDEVAEKLKAMGA
jgi:hypothetical protein